MQNQQDRDDDDIDSPQDDIFNSSHAVDSGDSNVASRPTPQSLPENHESIGTGLANSRGTSGTPSPASGTISSLTSSKSAVSAQRRACEDNNACVPQPPRWEHTGPYLHSDLNDINDLIEEKDWKNSVSVLGHPTSFESFNASAVAMPIPIDEISLEKEGGRRRAHLLRDRRVLALVVVMLATVTAVAVFFVVSRFSRTVKTPNESSAVGNNDTDGDDIEQGSPFSFIYISPFSMEVANDSPDDGFDEKMLLNVTSSHLEGFLRDTSSYFVGLELDIVISDQERRSDDDLIRALEEEEASTIIFARFNGAVKINNDFLDSTDLKTIQAITQAVVVRAFSPPHVDTLLSLLKESGMAVRSVTVYDSWGNVIGSSGGFDANMVPTVLPTAFDTALEPTVLPTAFDTALEPTVLPTTFDTALEPTVLPTAFDTALEPTPFPAETRPTSDSTSTEPATEPTPKTEAVNPTPQPTTSPENPTQKPADQVPEPRPTRKPKGKPKKTPSPESTRKPTAQPTRKPLIRATAKPAGKPSSETPATPQPTRKPPIRPTRKPAGKPDREPAATQKPSRKLPTRPTEKPAGKPRSEPAATQKPSRKLPIRPTVRPTRTPDRDTIQSPTAPPATPKPSKPPQLPIAQTPTAPPATAKPSKPTQFPNAKPSGNPTPLPSSATDPDEDSTPTSKPTLYPAVTSTREPSFLKSTRSPISHPTSGPTQMPSRQTLLSPTASSTQNPSQIHSSWPSEEPTLLSPTASSTQNPSQIHSSWPSEEPTYWPTTDPTSIPSPNPSFRRTTAPSTSVGSNGDYKQSPGATGKPTADRILSLALSISGEAIFVPGTPQHEAFDWLFNYDEFLLSHNGRCDQMAMERYLMGLLYFAFSGENWWDSSKYLGSDTVCDWCGVRCDSNGLIEALDLSGNGLRGSIPTEISNLKELEFLNLQRNELSGTIPAELGKLTQLEVLSLHGNGLRGSIPTEISNLKELEILNLQRNELNGTIPNELGKLTKLEMLLLHDNNISGRIPSYLGRLTHLTRLYLDQNMLTGAIPSSLENLHYIEKLRFHKNNLTGTMPVNSFCDFLLGYGGSLYELSADCEETSMKVNCSCCTCCGENCGDCGEE